MIKLMKWSRKGAKDNRLKLAWSKYYKYTYKDKDYYFKEKAYVTYNDGFTKIEPIKKETYRNAQNRKKNCYEIRAEDISSLDKESIEKHKTFIKIINKELQLKE